MSQISGRRLAEAKVAPDLPEVLRPRLPPLAIPHHLGRGDVELPRHVGDDRLGDGAQVVGAESGKRSVPNWSANHRRLAGEVFRGTCLRSARERVK